MLGINPFKFPSLFTVGKRNSKLSECHLLKLTLASSYSFVGFVSIHLIKIIIIIIIKKKSLRSSRDLIEMFGPFVDSMFLFGLW